jgi:hypothetical protein
LGTVCFDYVQGEEMYYRDVYSYEELPSGALVKMADGIEEVDVRMFFNNENMSMWFYPCAEFTGAYELSNDGDFDELEPSDIIEVHNGLVLVCSPIISESIMGNDSEMHHVYRKEVEYASGYSVSFCNCSETEAALKREKFNEGYDGYSPYMNKPEKIPVGYLFTVTEPYNG